MKRFANTILASHARDVINRGRSATWQDGTPAWRRRVRRTRVEKRGPSAIFRSKRVLINVDFWTTTKRPATHSSFNAQNIIHVAETATRYPLEGLYNFAK